MRPLPPEALYALSADPWTLGHSSVLDMAKERYKGRVLVGIANDPKKNYAFAQWERLRLAQKSLDVPAEDVRLVPGSLAKYLLREDVPVLVRGIRNALDEAAETTLKFYYLSENPELSVDVMRADPDSRYAEISSSGVKECLKVGHDISNFVSSSVKQALESRIVRQYPVCVTGEMGAGKSTLSKKIADEARKFGIACTYVEYDSVAHEIYFSLTDPVYEKTRRKVAEAFGESVVTADGFIDREELARIIRDDKTKVNRLNEILRKPMLLRYGDIVAGKQGLILVDAALLVEFGLTHLGNHHAVVVTAPTETRVERVIGRYAKKGFAKSREDVLKMFSLQMQTEEKVDKLEAVIAKEKNGSILTYDNGETEIDARKALFDILAKVDVFGELRAQMSLRMLGMSELESAALVAELKKKHEEPHRFYHTWEHIIELLGNLFERGATTDLPQEQVAVLAAAILFHDSVYEVKKTYYRDNEVHSAEYARRALSSRGIASNRVDEIYNLVRDTAHGSGEKPTDYLSMILHDLDMSILAAAPERYALYVSDIMREFGIYPGREFAKARAELLRKWIADDDLFVTGYGKEKYLEAARANMREELAKLEIQER